MKNLYIFKMMMLIISNSLLANHVYHLTDILTENRVEHTFVFGIFAVIILVCIFIKTGFIILDPNGNNIMKTIHIVMLLLSILSLAFWHNGNNNKNIILNYEIRFPNTAIEWAKILLYLMVIFVAEILIPILLKHVRFYKYRKKKKEKI